MYFQCWREALQRHYVFSTKRRAVLFIHYASGLCRRGVPVAQVYATNAPRRLLKVRVTLVLNFVHVRCVCCCISATTGLHCVEYRLVMLSFVLLTRADFAMLRNVASKSFFYK